MLYGTGLTPTDLQKPQVGICSMWWEGNTCNMHLDKLACDVKDGVQAAGLIGLRFNTIGVSDGISMGTDGMSYSLPSRDLIADSIETVVGAQWYDAVITIPGCDKNMPGSVMAMLRLNRPSLMVYGGTIKPGFAQGKPRDVISAFQSYGEYLAGVITDDQRLDIVMHACPGAGCRTVPPRPPKTPVRKRNADARVSLFSSCSKRTSSRAISSARNRSRTPS
jgi:dihydroxy-acid dehydratase